MKFATGLVYSCMISKLRQLKEAEKAGQAEDEGANLLLLAVLWRLLIHSDLNVILFTF